MQARKDTEGSQQSVGTPRQCAYRFCKKLLPAPVRSSGQPRRFCNGSCRKAEWTMQLRDAELRREEEARQRREKLWESLLPDTRKALQRVLFYSGQEVANQLTEAIIAEIQRAGGKP